jgi:hypothetical protein
VAIAAARVQRDTALLLRGALGDVGPDLGGDDVDELVSRATADLDIDEESPFWRLVDQVARLRDLTDRELALVADILDVVAARAVRGGRDIPRR